MARDDHPAAKSEDGDKEAEGFDAAHDLLDLRLGVSPRVGGVGMKTVGRDGLHLDLHSRDGLLLM